MKLTELYREQAAKAAMWNDLRSNKTPQVGERFSERAWECAANADDLAHCIATFGDVDIDDPCIRTFQEKAEHKNFPGRNPWARGVSLLLERHIEEVSRSLLNASRNDTAEENS